MMSLLSLYVVIGALPAISPAHSQVVYKQASAQLSSYVIRGVQTTNKIVALTYDDGPHPVFTPEILRVLDKYHVKATFFMIGSRMEQYPWLVREVIARGHAIGNHTYSHPPDFKLSPTGQIDFEIDKCEDVIRQLCGTSPRLFRPPKGLVSNNMLALAMTKGYETVLWTVCADNHNAPTPEAMAKRVISRVRPGAIILAHDGMYPMRWRDVAATPLIIEGLLKQGYRFVTVPELLSSAQIAKAEREDRKPKVPSATGKHTTPRRVKPTS